MVVWLPTRASDLASLATNGGAVGDYVSPAGSAIHCTLPCAPSSDSFGAPCGGKCAERYVSCMPPLTHSHTPVSLLGAVANCMAPSALHWCIVLANSASLVVVVYAIKPTQSKVRSTPTPTRERGEGGCSHTAGMMTVGRGKQDEEKQRRWRKQQQKWLWWICTTSATADLI